MGDSANRPTGLIFRQYLMVGAFDSSREQFETVPYFYKIVGIKPFTRLAVGLVIKSVKVS
jgi:hypothetical protein